LYSTASPLNTRKLFNLPNLPVLSLLFTHNINKRKSFLKTQIPALQPRMGHQKGSRSSRILPLGTPSGLHHCCSDAGWEFVAMAINSASRLASATPWGGERQKDVVGFPASALGFYKQPGGHSSAGDDRQWHSPLNSALCQAGQLVQTGSRRFWPALRMLQCIL